MVTIRIIAGIQITTGELVEIFHSEIVKQIDDYNDKENDDELSADIQKYGGTSNIPFDRLLNSNYFAKAIDFVSLKTEGFIIDPKIYEGEVPMLYRNFIFGKVIYECASSQNGLEFYPYDFLNNKKLDSEIFESVSNMIYRKLGKFDIEKYKFFMHFRNN